jgi:transmembrane sensor
VREQQPLRPFKVAAVGAAAVVAGLLGLRWWMAHSRSVVPVPFSTAVGGYQRQLLSDGSTVELNTLTAIEVMFDTRVRRIQLLYGEARFHVAKEAARPFLVQAGPRMIRAVEADFSIHVEPELTTVLVAEGRVGVESPRGKVLRERPIVLRPGQLCEVRVHGVSTSDLSPPSVAARLAWDRGMLMFTQAKLATVVDELNRYNRLQIRIADGAAAALAIDGTFSATNAAAFLHRLEESFPVKVTPSADGVTVASRD